MALNRRLTARRQAFDDVEFEIVMGGDQKANHITRRIDLMKQEGRGYQIERWALRLEKLMASGEKVVRRSGRVGGMARKRSWLDTEGRDRRRQRGKPRAPSENVVPIGELAASEKLIAENANRNRQSLHSTSIRLQPITVCLAFALPFSSRPDRRNPGM
jgi:hypothetical protein